jgi:hypothetical protein
MIHPAPATLFDSPAVAGLGTRDDHGGSQDACRREVRGRRYGARRPGRGPAKAGRVLVDARGRAPHRPVSPRAGGGWRPIRRA